MVMSVYSRTGALPALRPVGSSPRARVVQPTVHRQFPVDQVPEKGHDERRRDEHRGDDEHVRPEGRFAASR